MFDRCRFIFDTRSRVDAFCAQSLPYTGNVHDVEGGTTFCPACHEASVRRDWYSVLSCRIETSRDAHGGCPLCATPIAGRFGAFAGGFGRRRIPVRMALH